MGLAYTGRLPDRDLAIREEHIDFLLTSGLVILLADGDLLNWGTHDFRQQVVYSDQWVGI